MVSASFSITVHSFRTLPTPIDSSEGIRTYSCIVPVSTIPKAFSDWMEVNAREPSINGKVPNAIRTTLIHIPEWFVVYNRGLAILAEAVEYDNKAREVKITFKDKAQHGVFDGGHTLAVILDEGEHQEAYCRLEIMTGVPQNMITEIVEARNTSRQVASKSLMNLDGKFAKLKDALGPNLSDLISWRENMEAPIDVRELIALLTTLDRTHYDDTKHPLIAYAGKEACLKHFESSPSCYEKIYPLAKDIIRLWDQIQADVPEQYNNQGGKFGGLKGCSKLKTPRPLPVLGGTTGYLVPNGYLYPIIAAFRSMMVEVNGVYTWGKGVDPCKLVRDGLATRIFSGPVVNSIKDIHNPNRTGKDANVWALAYQIAENYFLRI